jgi:hypothetical protein
LNGLAQSSAAEVEEEDEASCGDSARERTRDKGVRGVTADDKYGGAQYDDEEDEEDDRAEASVVANAAEEGGM